MTARSNTAMLELWRPPAAAGDPVRLRRHNIHIHTGSF